MIFLKDLMLQRPRLTLTAAESMTCGRVQALIGSVSGASNFFLGGVTAYSLEEKVRHLGVSRAGAKRVDCVSAAVAEQMAGGACRLFGADVGVASTGYAEASVEKKVSDPFAWWALVHLRRRSSKPTTGNRVVTVRHGRIECPGASRVEAQSIVADAIVAELVAYLREFRAG